MVAKLARQRTRAMSLAFLMVMMVQTGYLGTTDPWWSIEQDEVAPCPPPAQRALRSRRVSRGPTSSSAKP